MNADTLGPALLARARNAIGLQLGFDPADEPDAPGLDAPAATFVTLTARGDGALRGCIGTLEAGRPLEADVRGNAVAAAFRDPRFDALSRGEYPQVRVEVSLLGAAEPVDADGEAQALRALRPFEDGVIVEWRGRRATFLPQVWEALPEPARFLGELRRKAGLPAGFWAEDLRLSRYRVAKWREEIR